MEASVPNVLPAAPAASENDREVPPRPISGTVSHTHAAVLTRTPPRASEDAPAPTAGPSVLPIIGQGAVRNAPLAPNPVTDDADSLVSDIGYLASLSIGSDPLASTHESAADAQLASSSTTMPGTADSFVMVNIAELMKTKTGTK